MATECYARVGASPLSVKRQQRCRLLRSVLGRFFVVAALGVLGWCASLLGTADEATAVEQTSGSGSLTGAVLGSDGLVGQATRSVDDTVHGSLHRLGDQRAVSRTGDGAGDQIAEGANVEQATGDRGPQADEAAKSLLDRTLGVRLPVSAKLARGQSVGVLGAVDSVTGGMASGVPEHGRTVVTQLTGGLQPMLPVVSQQTGLSSITSMAGLTEQTQLGRAAGYPATVTSVTSQWSAGHEDVPATVDASTPKRIGKLGAAVPPGVDGSDRSPVVPPLRDLPGGSTSPTSQIGNGSGSVGSPATAEPLRMLAAWRPAPVTWLTDADISSDDGGRPPVSPD